MSLFPKCKRINSINQKQSFTHSLFTSWQEQPQTDSTAAQEPYIIVFMTVLTHHSIYDVYILKMLLRREASVMHREENEKFEQNSICKACEEIVQYYCCYHWCGLISRPFHYLTTTTKLIYKQEFWKNPQISCASKKDERE